MSHHIKRAKADWWLKSGSNWMASMPPERIAIHSFVDGPNGRRCSKCNKLWVDISWVGKEQIGWDGISCYGKLTEEELEQIVAQREAEFEAGRGA